MSKSHEVEKLGFKNNKMILEVDGRELVFPLSKISARLSHASKIERENYRVSPSGYGIHWPLIDEDLSIDGLIGVIDKKKRDRGARDYDLNLYNKSDEPLRPAVREKKAKYRPGK